MKVPAIIKRLVKKDVGNIHKEDYLLIDNASPTTEKQRQALLAFNKQVEKETPKIEP